jgi:hypothetical protein
MILLLDIGRESCRERVYPVVLLLVKGNAYFLVRRVMLASIDDVATRNFFSFGGACDVS